ncbi:MAG TPA: CHASE3 domain-containing protein [Nitrospira sp.]|nr:CHASE3 domain-containing protein [Nitrospira sp.]
MKWTERKLAFTGLGLGLLVLIGLVTYAVNRRSEQASQREAFREIRTVLEYILARHSYLSDAESRQRGDLLTHDPTYLAPYHVATEKIPAVLTHLEQETKQDSGQRKHIEALRPLTERKLVELRTSLEMTTTSPTDAIEFGRSKTGRLLMEDLRC